VLRSGEVEQVSQAPKREVADRILDQVGRLRLASAAAAVDS
jgi:hypothetical protein